MSTRLTSTRLAVLALIISHFIWGANAPILKWALQDLSPFTLGFLRFSFGALILLPFCLNKLEIEKKDMLKIVLISFFLIFINIAFFLVGLHVASSIDAPIIGSAGPIFIIFGAIFFLHERLAKRVVIGTLISLIGVVIVIIRPFIEQSTRGAILGDIFFLIATFATVIGTILLKKYSLKYPVTTVVFWIFIIGAFCFLPMFVMENISHPVLQHLSMRSIIGIGYASIFASAIAYVLFLFSMHKMHTTDVGIFNYMDPVITVLIAIPLLGEHLTLSYFIGAFFVFIGIFIAEKRIPWHPLHKLRGN